MSVDRATWQIASSLGPVAESTYWCNVRVFLIRLDCNEDAEYAIAKLIESGLAIDALDQAASHPEELVSHTLIWVLDANYKQLSEQPEASRSQVFGYDLGRILDALQHSGKVRIEELGRLEWQFFPFLRNGRGSVALGQLLQRDPEFFATLVEFAFEPERDDGDDSDEADLSGDAAITQARLAWDLLHDWQDVPACREDGSLDRRELQDWVSKARTCCAAKRRLGVGDIQIGRVLCYAPTDADGINPPAAVREIIEEVRSRDLESGLESGFFNQRGVHCKSPFDGGLQERSLAKRYRGWAKAVLMTSPRTARLLNSLADTYERMARREDVNAEWRDSTW